MEKIRFIITLALYLLIIGCQDELTRENHDACFSMTISNALPVQFWLNGEESYNEKEVCGVTKICFNQPFQCDDEIRIQFKEEDSEQDYFLQVLDASDNILETIPFEKLIPEQQMIEVDVDPLQFAGYEFEGGLGGWTQINGQFPYTPAGIEFQWVDIDGDIIIRASGEGGATRSIGQARPDLPLRGWPPGDYSVRITARNNSVNGMAPKDLTVAVLTGDPMDGSLTVTGQKTWPNQEDIPWGTLTQTINFTLSEHKNFLWFHFFKSGPDSGYDLSLDVHRIQILTHPLTELIPDPDYNPHAINEVVFTPSDYSICNQEIRLKIIKDGSPDEEIAYSDLLSIRTEHPCTLAIDYTNNKDFYGITYQEVSPQPIFRLRIPAIFFEEDNPAEQEDHELSSGEIVRLYSKLEQRRKLDIGFLPNYLHRKVQLVLMHDVVSIDGKEWIRREAYERIEGNKRYPLKRASVWLHDKNYIKENQL
jgi:hypothetical protein